MEVSIDRGRERRGGMFLCVCVRACERVWRVHLFLGGEPVSGVAGGQAEGEHGE